MAHQNTLPPTSPKNLPTPGVGSQGVVLDLDGFVVLLQCFYGGFVGVLWFCGGCKWFCGTYSMVIDGSVLVVLAQR